MSSIRDFANEAQLKCLDALKANHHDKKVAAKSLGMTPGNFQRNMKNLRRTAASRGFSPDEDFTNPTPEGFLVKATSTLYDPEGNVKQQWVKTERDKEKYLEDLKEAAQIFVEPFRKQSRVTAKPKGTDADLLTVYPIGDHHHGLFTTKTEVGEDYDLSKSETILTKAMDKLVYLAPKSKEALIIDLGDFNHSDNARNRTEKSNHSLDVDGRQIDIMKSSIRLLKQCIDLAAEKHEKVTISLAGGNHDGMTSMFLSMILEAHYENHKRVVVMPTGPTIHSFEFGANLIAWTHGDTIKMPAVPSVMACDFAQAWGRTKFRRAYTGHVHHDWVKEYPGCIVESTRVLPPGDYWHNSQGYRSGRDMKSDVYHRNYGRITRNIIGVSECGNG